MSSTLKAVLADVSRRVATRGRLSLVLVLPLCGASLMARVCADKLAETISLDLSAAVAPLTQAYESVTEPARDEDAILSETPALRAAVHEARAHRVQPVAGPSAGRGIRVSAAQVLALAERRAMPQAVPVKANAYHPAGLLLRGVGALGIGMQDGDVLTEAAGQKASSVAAVIGVVLAARARLSPVISGRFYRAGVPFSVTVEQPYPKNAVPG